MRLSSRTITASDHTQQQRKKRRKKKKRELQKSTTIGLGFALNRLVQEEFVAANGLDTVATMLQEAMIVDLAKREQSTLSTPMVIGKLSTDVGLVRAIVELENNVVVDTSRTSKM